MQSSAGFAVIVASLVACRGPQATQPPPEPKPTAPERSIEAPREEILPCHWCEESAAWPTMVESSATQHLAIQSADPAEGKGPLNARVRVSPNAADAYRNWTRGSLLPPGTVLVSELHDAAGELLWRFAMEREASRWRFEVLGPNGRVLHSEHAGACAACHEHATSQNVFGPPRQ